MSLYQPTLEEKIMRPGCEFEYIIRGPRGDPESFEDREIITMPSTFKKPLNYATDLIILPHPTLREYVPFLSHSEIDPEYHLYPYPRPRNEPKDEIELRNDRTMAGLTTGAT